MVALVVLMNGCCLLNMLPRSLCWGQLRHRVFYVVKELFTQATHHYDDVEPPKDLPPFLPVGGLHCHHQHPQSGERQNSDREFLSSQSSDNSGYLQISDRKEENLQFSDSRRIVVLASVKGYVGI